MMDGWKQGREWKILHQPSTQMGESGPPSIPESIYESLDERWSQVRQVQDAARGRRSCLSESPPPVHVPHSRPGGGANHHRMDPTRLPMSTNMSRGNPRQIQIERKDNGFGFTLRHFIVYPPEEGCDNGPPITEPMDTIFVKSVKEMGPAVRAGLNIGDRIVSVNGETVSGRSYAQVVQLIQKSRDTLFLVVVPREDDILQVYFSEIAQNPESNRRDGSQPPQGSKPHWPGASVCSSSSRESSPFSSKTSDSTRDSVYGHNKDYSRHSRDVPSLQHDAGEGVPRQFASQSIYGSLSRPPETHWSHQAQEIGSDKLLQVPEPEHVYAVVGNTEPFWGATSAPIALSNNSSNNTLGSSGTWPVNSNNSRESLDSDGSVAAGFNSKPDESLISKIKKDCEMKEEFLKNQTYPAYLSSPPKEVDTSPYGIANLSSTMPPSRLELLNRKASPPTKEDTPVADGSGLTGPSSVAGMYSGRRRSSSRGRLTSKRGSVSIAIEKINIRQSPEQEKRSMKPDVFPIPQAPRPLKKAFDIGKKAELSTDRMRKLSDEAVLDGEPVLRAACMMPRSSIISSVPIPKPVESEENRKKIEDEKTFSVSLYVNENEKNKIVDMLHKAKSLISKKVEKVMGKKPKASISNVDAMQMVLEHFVEHEEREERREREEEEKLILEQGLQVEIRRSLGQDAPVKFPPVPSVSVEEQEDDLNLINEDMEVSRLTSHHLLKPPSRRRLFSPQQSPTCLSPTRSLSPADHVPCPFGNRPDSELYPARLRRPSSHYGAGAAAASSRPPSRSVSVSPSLPVQEEKVGEAVKEKLEEKDDDDEEEWEYEDAEEEIHPYCRPESFVIPIGGVWNPSEESDVSGPSWGKVEETGNSWGKVEDLGANSAWGNVMANKEAKQEVSAQVEETIETVEEKTEGYQRGNRGNNWSYDNSYDDAFSRNNFVIVGGGKLHCEPPQVYQPTIPRPPDNEEERNLRRISYLQATKEDPMDVEDNLTGDSGLAPTHSIKKLKSIFSEKASENQPPSLPPPPSPRTRELKPTEHSLAPATSHSVPDGTMEGYLTCKVAMVDGKKAIDRSWKTVYVILKSSILYMYKDKKLALANPDDTEEKPVKLNETEVAVADDYTKRKNVFRVKTEGLSEYLFQAEDEGLMKNWVQAIDAAAMAVIVDERKDANKLRKLTSFRNRSPTGQSPSNKSRKSSTDTIPPFKDKDKKNWKGKVVKQLKKMGGGSHGPLYPEGGSVGVPIEECPLCPATPDSFSDTIPYLVKICCDIVNERGLDIIGIYRVPGNNAAVTYLTDLVNKGQEHYQLDDHRWQDVNVVSSLLKSFFRKLPDPLFTMEMYNLFIDASKLEQPAKRLDLLRKLIRDLPEINYETLKYLCAHLCNVVDHSAVNKMEIRNLAIVFGPTLVRTSDDNMVSMVTDMSQQCRIIESILSNNDFFFNDIDEAVINDEEEENNLITGVGNQSIMLANLAKLEDAGKVQSPKNDMSTKDIVTSIISAANRKMLRSAAGSKGKKESLTDYERSEDSRASESRRDSESVLHGALQIASAVPGLIGPIATNDNNSGRDTPDLDFRQFYGRQSSRGSISGDLMGMGNLGKRRGSLPVCQSKRGSICEYSGGAMCESTPVGELCETRMAIMQVANQEVATEVKETVTNGEGGTDNQQVVTTGKLSLNVSGVVQNSVSTASAIGSRQGTQDHDCMHDHDMHTNGKNTKFPIETYAGLDAATAERIKKFEAETKAMLTRPVAVGSSFSRSTQELSEQSFQESAGPTSLRSATLSARISGLRGSPLASSSMASLPRPSNIVTSLSRASNSVTSLPKASNSVTNLPKASDSVTIIPKASNSVASLSMVSNSISNIPRARNSFASNSTTSLPRASSVSSSSSIRASISSVGSLEPPQPTDPSKIRSEPLQPADPSKCRLTTPDPDPGPLDGGILLQEPYPSDQLYPAMPSERRFLSLSYRTSLPNLPVGACPALCSSRRPSLERPDPSADFDTKKIMSNGTLMRLKQRRPELLMEGGGGTVETIFDCGEEREQEHMEETSSTEKLLSNLTVSFDQKMRLLLDPNYQSSSSSSSPAASRSIQQLVQHSSSSSSSPAGGRSIQQLVQHSSSSSSSSPATGRSIQQLVHQSESSCSSPVSPVRLPMLSNSATISHNVSPASTSHNCSPSHQVLLDAIPHPLASLAAARNLSVALESHQAKMSPENKKELDEARNIAQQVRQGNKKVELRRGVRVDKHTEPVLRQVNCRKERVRRSDSLTKKEKTELNQLKKRDGGEKENKVTKLRDHFERSSGVKPKSTKIDVNKLRKKLSERNNRRIKRRHTVGGTKDFGDGVVSGARRNGHTAWDRLQPLVTDEELNVERSLGVWLKRNRPANRRLSLPDSAAVSAALKLPKHMESHV